MLGTPPSHVLGTSILYTSLLHDSRFREIPMSEAAPGDILIASHPSQADGYAGIVVDHGRIVSDSSQGVRDNSSLVEIQRSQPTLVLFRYVGVQGSRSYPLANQHDVSNEPRIPAGQPGGGQWTSEFNPNRMTSAEELLPTKLPPGDTNVERTNKSLPLDKNYQRPRKRQAQVEDAKKGTYVTHYGPGTKIGGWDPFNDPGTNSGFGLRGTGGAPLLNNHSVALSADVAANNGISPGDPVYVNGHFVGFYNDRAPEPGTIDIYDQYNIVNDVDWGGMVWGARVSNHP